MARCDKWWWFGGDYNAAGSATNETSQWSQRTKATQINAADVPEVLRKRNKISGYETGLHFFPFTKGFVALSLVRDKHWRIRLGFGKIIQNQYKCSDKTKSGSYGFMSMFFFLNMQLLSGRIFSIINTKSLYLP